MIQVLLFIFILLLSFPADAAYKVYLRNGSAISGVSSYEKRDGEVIIYFGGGSMGIPEKDILKIEDTEAPEKDFRRTERTNVLRAELESTNSELKAVEEDEARVTKLINDRKGSRLTYNALQLRQLEADMAPLQQELSDLQVKKGGLLQRKASIEGELRSLEQ
jgi:hypothetical protein